MDKNIKKEKYMEQGIEVLKGSPDDLDNYVYKFKDSGLYVREVEYETNKGGAPIEICQITDTHISLLNDKDKEENNPSVMSTYERRGWLRNGTAIPMLETAMEYASLFDQTVISGDIIDYLTWGSLEYITENILKVDKDVIFSLGGHDITRVMTGLVPDETTLESRKEIVSRFIPHDIDYHSEVLGDKVIVVAINNGETKYYERQLEALKKDIEKARKENLIILIFQHEPIATRNPDEKAVLPICDNDDNPKGFNFYDNEHYIGSHSIDDVTDEVYNMMTGNADVIKGIFCGHEHYDYKTEIINGDNVTPQYVLGINAYRNGRVMKIKVK